MVGRDTPKPIRSGTPCKTSHGQAVVVEPRIPRLSPWGVSTSEYLDVSQFFRDHSEGNLIRYDAFTSTSKEIYDETMDIQIVMKVKHGKDISKWNDNESEVLLPRGTRFCVIKTDGKTIYMEEL